LYDTVLRGQMLAFKKIRDGAATAEIHNAIVGLFEQEGYRTGRHHGRMQGFFHGTGHGLGLEIHEAPRIGSSSRGVLKAGHVVTVEPGLYYPGLGAVRIEDMVLVTKDGCRNLTCYPKVFELG
jgi:Xaa-Pro aminopeptidase